MDFRSSSQQAAVQSDENEIYKKIDLLARTRSDDHCEPGLFLDSEWWQLGEWWEWSGCPPEPTPPAKEISPPLYYFNVRVRPASDCGEDQGLGTQSLPAPSPVLEEMGHAPWYGCGISQETFKVPYWLLIGARATRLPSRHCDIIIQWYMSIRVSYPSLPLLI